MAIRLKAGILQVLTVEDSSLILVRNVLNGTVDFIQLDNIFYISGTRGQILSAKSALHELPVEFSMVYIAVTNGSWVDAVGITPQKLTSIRRSINPKFNYPT